MANIRTILQTFFADAPLMLQIFDTAGIFDPKNKKNISIDFSRESQGEAYDVHHITFSYHSDEPILDYIHLRTFSDTLKSLVDGTTLLKVFVIDYAIEEDSEGEYDSWIEFVTVDRYERV